MCQLLDSSPCSLPNAKQNVIVYVYLQPTESVQIKVVAKVRPLAHDEQGAKKVAKVSGDKVSLEVGGKVLLLLLLLCL